ncbi:DUF3137 domain-containing protein [Oscillospiraceae bacterium PP1C4]
MTTLSELEKLRKSAKFFLVLNIVIVVVATPFWPSPISIALCIIGGILFLTVVRKKMTGYKSAFKSNIVKASLAEVFSELSYESDQGVSAEEVKNSELVDLKDEFNSNDLIIAKYGKVRFKQADIAISEKSKRVGEDGIPHEETKICFTGRFLVFDFLKPTDAPVKVMGKSFSPESFNQGVISALTSRLIVAENKHQVFMESELFNNNFNVFCSDAQTAFYILTPQIVEAITMLSKQYQGKIALCFRDKKMFVAISSKKDSLEAKLISNRTIWEEKELVLKDIKVITDFINLMSLENNTLVAASN